VQSSLHVKEIAYQLGFEDASYFVKYFKKHALLSPSAFRKAVSKAGRRARIYQSNTVFSILQASGQAKSCTRQAASNQGNLPPT